MEYVAVVTREGPRLLVEFPDAPGCQTFAEPGEDLAAQAKEAIEGWLEAHLATGAAPPRPKARHRAPAGARLLSVRLPPQLSVGLQVRWARQKAGLSQGGMARQLGVTRQAISQLEDPDGNVTVRTLEKVAGMLGLEVDVRLVAKHSAA